MHDDLYMFMIYADKYIYIYIHIHALCKKYIYADTQILLGSHLNGLQLYESLLLYRDI